ILKRSTIDSNALVRNMADALLNGNLSNALLALRCYIANIPYDIITKQDWEEKEKRESFYKLLLYMVFSVLNSKVGTEVKSNIGRADVVIKTKSDIFVLELEVDDTVENALSQIEDKGYAIPYEANGRKVTKCGVVISSEKRNITQWRMVDENGVVIDYPCAKES
ncbi:MAG: PD-(D/E)XK nuclease domain-containing protein, partial [Alistipes sp.]|nr:PD-(D/E)XK nuclease domain-containing protein [Candidatus Alistipes equi]